MALEMHAAKTGHSAFSESSDIIAPLTAEEKAAKVEKLKMILAKRRAEREDTEKVRKERSTTVLEMCLDATSHNCLHVCIV